MQVVGRNAGAIGLGQTAYRIEFDLGELAPRLPGPQQSRAVQWRHATGCGTVVHGLGHANRGFQADVSAPRNSAGDDGVGVSGVGCGCARARGVFQINQGDGLGALRQLPLAGIKLYCHSNTLVIDQGEIGDVEAQVFHIGCDSCAAHASELGSALDGCAAIDGGKVDGYHLVGQRAVAAAATAGGEYGGSDQAGGSYVKGKCVFHGKPQ